MPKKLPTTYVVENDKRWTTRYSTQFCTSHLLTLLPDTRHRIWAAVKNPNLASPRPKSPNSPLVFASPSGSIHNSDTGSESIYWDAQMTDFDPNGEWAVGLEEDMVQKLVGLFHKLN